MKTVLLSAGHSNADPGACANGLREADCAVEARNITSFYLTQAGVPHDLDGKGTTNMPLREAAKKARQATISVEFHCNASESASASGSETLCAPPGMKLGAALSAAAAGALTIRNRGAKPEGSGQHSTLAFVQDTDVILEMFFITNKTDVDLWQRKKWLMCKAVADVIIKAAKA